MGYHIELNSLLVVPDGTLDFASLQTGDHCTLTKNHERLYPVNVPLEFCDANYTYIGKAIVRKLTIEKGKTTLEFEVLKLFTPDESKVFSSAFIPV